MSGWESELATLGHEVAWPATPDMATRVGALLTAPPRRRRPRVLRLVLVVLPAGTVLAVSSDARDALRDWLGLDGVEIRLVETLPPTPPASPVPGADLRLGEESSVPDAAARLPFRPLVPRALGAPDYVWLDPDLNQVSLVYAPRRNLPHTRETGVGLLVMELPARLDPVLFQKYRTEGTRIIRLRVRGAPAIGLEGAAHTVVFRDSEGNIQTDRTRLAANVLLIQRGKLLIRMEGAIPVRRMARIAESLRPA
jgi:hypothetical protein